MQLWGNPTNTAVDENQAPPDDENDYEDYVLTHFPSAWKFLIDSHAYEWLLGKVRSEILLTEAKGTRMEVIRDEILNCLRAKPREVGYLHEVYTASFEISCHLLAFIKEQYPDEENLELGSIITITGSSVDAQALTCAEYMRQVWPTTGLEVLDALQQAILKGPRTVHKCEISFSPSGIQIKRSNVRHFLQFGR
jgi:hypothetical protein